MHPVCSWAFRHSAWILNRFVPRSGQTPHFLIHGEEFKGKCCKFGEMVMAYVASDFKQKGTAKWMPMIFAGISETKQYIVLHGKTMRLTRSFKRIFPDASQHLAAYQQLLVCSWMCEGIIGTRLKPSTAKHLRPDTGQDLDLEDEAALDPEDIEALLGYDMPPILVPPTHDVPDIGKSQLADPSENITVPLSTADAPMDSSVVSEPIGLEEPSAKRQKMTTSRIGHFRYPHVDDTDISMGMDFDFGVFPDVSDTGLNDSHDPDYQEGGDDVDFGNEDEERLWWPFSPEEPVLDSALLVELDAIADQLEVTRLQEMSVLVKEEELSPEVELGGDLTARLGVNCTSFTVTPDLSGTNETSWPPAGGSATAPAFSPTSSCI